MPIMLMLPLVAAASVVLWPVHHLNETVHVIGDILEVDGILNKSDATGTADHRFNKTRHKLGELLETFKGELFQLDKKDKETKRLERHAGGQVICKTCHSIKFSCVQKRFLF